MKKIWGICLSFIVLLQPSFGYLYANISRNFVPQLEYGGTSAIPVQIQWGDFSPESIQETMMNIMRGLGQGMQEGSGDFGQGMQELLRNVSSSAGAGLTKGSEDLGKGIGDLVEQGAGGFFAGGGRALQDALKPGSSFMVGTDKIRALTQDVINASMKNYAKFLGIGAAGFAAKSAIPFIIRRIEHMLNAPQLIIESSNKTILQRIKDYFKGSENLEMVFEPKVEKRLNGIIKTVHNVNKRIREGKKNVTYRNLLLYGPPGTGKTMFARELARRSGMEWAMMSGSSFAKFKEGEGIKALDDLFAWANRSKGLMLFIDEAETFLRDRKGMVAGSEDYKILNNFLNYTGTPSNKFMIVFATNYKKDLDSAMYDRIQDYVEVPLPTESERIKLLNLYKNKLLMSKKDNGEAFVNSVEKYLGENRIRQIADATDGFAGRGLLGLINGILENAMNSDDGLVSPEVIDDSVDQALTKYKAFRE